jgi:hypothetical protein
MRVVVLMHAQTPPRPSQTPWRPFSRRQASRWTPLAAGCCRPRAHVGASITCDAPVIHACGSLWGCRWLSALASFTPFPLLNLYACQHADHTRAGHHLHWCSGAADGCGQHVCWRELLHGVVSLGHVDDHAFPMTRASNLPNMYVPDMYVPCSRIWHINNLPDPRQGPHQP